MWPGPAALARHFASRTSGVISPFFLKTAIHLTLSKCFWRWAFPSSLISTSALPSASALLEQHKSSWTYMFSFPAVEADLNRTSPDQSPLAHRPWARTNAPITEAVPSTRLAKQRTAMQAVRRRVSHTDRLDHPPCGGERERLNRSARIASAVGGPHL